MPIENLPARVSPKTQSFTVCDFRQYTGWRYSLVQAGLGAIP
jgi:hypothetical protein